MQINKAMILAAGYGKRMMPLTEKVPKPLITIGIKSLLERSIELLIKIGIKEIKIKEKQKVDKIVLSSLFKENKNFLEIEKIQLETVINIFGKVVDRSKETINKEEVAEVFKSIKKVKIIIEYYLYCLCIKLFIKKWRKIIKKLYFLKRLLMQKLVI